MPEWSYRIETQRYCAPSYALLQRASGRERAVTLTAAIGCQPSHADIESSELPPFDAKSITPVPTHQDIFAKTERSALDEGVLDDGSTANEDLYKNYHIKVDYNSEQTRFSFRKLLKFVGPGLLISQALLDPGNIESDISQAEVTGYKLLWLLLVAHVLCMFVQSMAARLGVVTGKHLAQHIKQQYPRWYRIIFWALSRIGDYRRRCAGGGGHSNGVPHSYGHPDLGRFLFLYIQRFGVRVTEMLFGLLITTLAVCFWIEMIMVKPDAKEVVKGMFIPRIPHGAAVQAVGVIGCVLMPHNLYLHSALVGTRKLDRSEASRVGAIREAMTYFRVEVVFSLIYAFLINMAVGGRVCQGNSHDGRQGSWLCLRRGVLAIGQSTTMAGTMAGQYVTEGFWNIPVKPWQRVIVTRAISLVPALAVGIAATNHMDMLSEIINVIQSVVMSVTIIPLLKLQMYPEVMGKEFAFAHYIKAASFALVTAIIVLNAYMIVSVIPLDSAGMYVALLRCPVRLHFRRAPCCAVAATVRVGAQVHC
ncbi:Nramp-domain-containing protein [Linderina pennispora]|uniref:Nramp-domain-containing protein n=1 Tax=Linderina pennispora TaxID=61395 RepID=A0A1Y1W5Q3_9FUNG|nr:Nramp-domain-containing protein [Linderina pennispora]ORX68698.1 Nramp-domain-containing protein [Linderina pennispora]